jgi:hypothetical protein
MDQLSMGCPADMNLKHLIAWKVPKLGVHCSSNSTATVPRQNLLMNTPSLLQNGGITNFGTLSPRTDHIGHKYVFCKNPEGQKGPKRPFFPTPEVNFSYLIQYR